LQAFDFLKRGIRINAICPGPTDTPLAQANADLWLSFAQDYRDATGTTVHQPEQMGDAMAFLNNAAASGVNGVTLLVDSGHAMSSLTNAFPPGKVIMDLITGRVKL
jgi:NAD(P)-dependent dehydrogenase (short-subunit alcohol dehydrogenase family)